jgi:hypothetical protein
VEGVERGRRLWGGVVVFFIVVVLVWSGRWYAEDVCMRVLVLVQCAMSDDVEGVGRATSAASISRGGDQGTALTNTRLGGSGGTGQKRREAIFQKPAQTGKSLRGQGTGETQAGARMSVSTVVQTA